MKRKFGILTVTALVLFMALFVKFWPIGMVEGKLYFLPVGERQLHKDEVGQFNYVYSMYEHMSFTGDEFHGWDRENQLLWRYGIAFSAYAMPSVAMISPDHRERAIHGIGLMIEKMKSRNVWGDWVDYGMGEDPISEGNIMYKGHLNLMYGLYQLMSGREDYSREFTWLTNKIVDEMRRHHEEGRHEGADCEPGRYFAQCNSISLMSLKIYDQLYNTNYSDVEAIWTVDFIKDRMTDKDYGFYLKMYQSVLSFCNPLLSGYTNAWTMTFLRTYEPEYNEKLYSVWKEFFTSEIGPYAFVKESNEAGASPLATMTGMIAAKEFGDHQLWTKLRNSVDRKIFQIEEDNHYVYKEINNPIYNGPLLWTKVHVGWRNILDHDWQGNKNYKIPDVAEMKWNEILYQELLVMNAN